MQHVSDRIGRAKGASLKPAREHSARILPLEIGVVASYMGGRSTGPRTPEGKARAAAAHTKHGRRSKAHLERVKSINAELRRITYELKRDGFIP